VGIHAAVLATVKPGQTLLLARNCHLSAFAACVLADCKPFWLQPQQDQQHGIAHCVLPEELQAGFAAAAAQGLTVAAVLIVSPSYFGAVARVQGESAQSIQQLYQTKAVQPCRGQAAVR
jgi:arginine/lysine/ornithine decarboxylase